MTPHNSASYTAKNHSWIEITDDGKITAGISIHEGHSIIPLLTPINLDEPSPRQPQRKLTDF